jgi:outer membrane protein, multidrug efflux system
VKARGGRRARAAEWQPVRNSGAPSSRAAERQHSDSLGRKSQVGPFGDSESQSDATNVVDIRSAFCKGCFAIAALALLTACTVGPKYQRASVPTPPAWTSPGPWQTSAPKDSLPRGPWWEIFQDAELNRFEQQLLKQNQTLAGSQARLEQARALAQIATSPFFPQVATDPNAQRQRVSGNRPVTGATAATSAVTQSVFNIPFALSYEVDVFGRVRRNLEAANASLQSNAADAQNVQLVLTSELAADYFSLREIDAEIAVVQQSVAYQQRGMDLVENRHRGGVASGLEVAQQAALLDSTKTQLALLQRQRSQFEHALAVLTGVPPENLTVTVAAFNTNLPPIPPGLPSDILERRPDVASAERAMAFTNAQVGLARAAFFPRITLSGATGLQSRDIGALFSAPSLFWALGADALQPVVTGGRNRANLAAARAGYDQSVANYRETVLTAFQQVEDGLTALNSLAQASTTQRAAVEDSRRALEIANNRYVGGLTTYLDVITAQSTLLANERLATQLLGQQLVTEVALVKALGGGWDASQIQNQTVRPTPKQILQP